MGGAVSLGAGPESGRCGPAEPAQAGEAGWNSDWGGPAGRTAGGAGPVLRNWGGPAEPARAGEGGWNRTEAARRAGAAGGVGPVRRNWGGPVAAGG